MFGSVLIIVSLFLNSTNQMEKVWDVVIYGSTSSGIAAAVQVERMGHSVILIEPGKHLGGLSSGGLGMTDIGNKDAIGGIAREFYQRIKSHYNNDEAWVYESREEYPYYNAGDTMWRFEPHIAEKVFKDMLREANVPLALGERLDLVSGVSKKDTRIMSITMESGKTFRGRMFIDATYEGDLMAKAGVSYTVGRESNDVYGETLNGVQKRRAVKHQFLFPIDPYVVSGKPSSGLLPGVHSEDPGIDSQGDHRVQAYCFRMCLTDTPENRLPFPRPEAYNPLRYELLLRYLHAGWGNIFGNHKMMPNRKTDTNNHGAFSTDNIGMNYEYPDGDYETRERIIKEHEIYQKGLMWFLVNDDRVPEKVRSEIGLWGLAKDEFVGSDHWPHQLYIREARRMISAYVMTEHNCRGAIIAPEPVGLGAYGMDSHNTQRYVDGNGHVRNEGDIQMHGFSPYPIDYRSIVPKPGECTNLLVPVCLSASHIAYGSIRMEPVFMALGQSAATAAVQAIEENIDVQKIHYPRLRDRLLKDGQIIKWTGKRRILAAALDSSKLRGIVLDDADVKFTGQWLQSTSVAPYVDFGYHHDNNTNKGTTSARFRVRLPKAGRYEVRLSYSTHSNRATNVPVIIHHADGVSTMSVNQREMPPIEGAFVSLGTYSFASDRQATVIINTEDTNGHVVVDAVQFLPLE